MAHFQINSVAKSIDSNVHSVYLFRVAFSKHTPEMTYSVIDAMFVFLWMHLIVLKCFVSAAKECQT